MKPRAQAKPQDPASDTGLLFPASEAAPTEDTDPIAEIWPGSHKIPSHWLWVRVADVGDVRLGRQRSPQHRSAQFPTKYIRAANITWRGLDLSDVLQMDFDPEEREIYALRKGDVLVAEASGSADQIGKPAIWRNELPLCCFQNTVIRFRPAGIPSEYAYLVFRYLAEGGVFTGLSRGVGIGHLGADRFAQLRFPLPPRDEQDRISTRTARVMERLERIQESLGRVEKNIELSRLSVVHDALRGKWPPPGNESAMAWPVVRVGDLCQATNGRAFKTGEWVTRGLPIIRIQNLRDPAAHFNYFDGEVDTKHRINPGDLLFAWSGTPGTSFGAFIWRGSKGALNQHIFKLDCDESRVMKRYMYYALNDQLERYVSVAQGGGGLAHISRADFLNTVVPLPPLQEQSQLVNAIDAHFAVLHNQEDAVARSKARLVDLRRSVMSRALSGNLVRQRQGEADVSALLNRVRVERARQSTELESLQRKRKAASRDREARGQRRVKLDLTKVLVKSGPMTTRQLFQAAGYREDDGDEFARFYDDLAAARRANLVEVEERQPKDESLCKAVLR